MSVSVFYNEFSKYCVICRISISKTQGDTICNNDTNLMLKDDYNYITTERRSFKTKNTARTMRKVDLAQTF